MPVVLIHQTQMTQDQYDQIIHAFSDGEGMNSPKDWPVSGLISHVTGQAPDGTWWVVDVWEDEESVQSFGQVLQGKLAELRIDVPPPVVFPAYKHVS